MKPRITATTAVWNETLDALKAVSWVVLRAKLWALKRYADWRVGARWEEGRMYRESDSILLTFDDYASRRDLLRLLRVLDRSGVKAAFFMQGDWAEDNPDLIELIQAEGHLLGNHTYSHPDLLLLEDEEVREQIERGPGSTWLRPPRGRYNDRIRRIAHDMGYRICYWTIDSDDWKGVSVNYMMRKILSELHPGAVILFHAHAYNTIEVLPRLIAEIRARGYKLCGADDGVVPELPA
ncbi:MAG TPA: polysaccharide deacetylase family protein [Candidatus Saccharimonas sp.]|nr:polysaccharide deacetylase family protein [Candidatus Saccharimonas sp.]